jgi:hypothetical protein
VINSVGSSQTGRQVALISALLMLADIGVAIYFSRDLPGFALHPTRIFDRMWLLPARGMLVANVVWAILGALLSLLPTRRRRVHS